MQLQQIEQDDLITSLIQFRTSSIFETLISFQSVLHPWQHQDWTYEAEKVLGKAFVQEAAELYNGYNLGSYFNEFVFDYSGADDFNDFLDYFEKLTSKEMAFYILGRVYPLEIIPDDVSVDSLGKMIAAYPELEMPNHTLNNSWAESPEQFKKKLFRLWSIYWNDFFSSRVTECVPYWSESLGEKEELFNIKGGPAFLKDICSHGKLPPKIPQGVPYTEIVVIPIYRTSRKSHMFYGYGNVTILYNCRRTKAVVEEIAKEKQKALQVIRALSDENRLKILKIIADLEHSCNGKGIAEKIGLSPSVVSRHLAQLRDAGIINEQSLDNRNITYTFKREIISQIPVSLLRYIDD